MNKFNSQLQPVQPPPDSHEGIEQNHDGLDGEEGGEEPRGEKEVKRKTGKNRGGRGNMGLLCDRHSSRPVALKVEVLKESKQWFQFTNKPY